MTGPARRPLPELPPEAADQVRFVLNEEDWQAFVKLLDRPEQYVSRLTEFLARPSVLDESESSVHADDDPPSPEADVTNAR